MKVAVIGCGNMGQALIKSIIRSGKLKKSSLMGCDISEKALKKLGIASTKDAVYAYKWADTVIIAVKPQQLEDLLLKLSGAKAKSKKVIISVVAGKTTKYFQGFLGGRTAVVRSMPNTPAFIGEGAIAICRSAGCGKKDYKKSAEILSLAGRVVEVDENLMDAVTAVSGSGPAYVFFLAEILISAAEKMGIDEPAAKSLVYQTIYGSSLLLKLGEKEPDELRENVTSPGGTTEAAFDYLGKSGVFEKWKKAVLAAKNRAKFLSE